MFENIEVDGRVLVPTYPKWVSNGLSPQKIIRYYNSLTRLYIIETPVKTLSSLSVPLESYGWTSPWSKPEYLNRKLKGAMSNQQSLYSSASYGAMEQTLSKAGLLTESVEKNPTECIVIYNNQKNQIMSTFYHIRNSLCHGRFRFFKDKRVIWVALEDVTKYKELNGVPTSRLSARMVIKYQTLLSWEKIIKNKDQSAK